MAQCKVHNYHSTLLVLHPSQFTLLFINHVLPSSQFTIVSITHALVRLVHTIDDHDGSSSIDLRFQAITFTKVDLPPIVSPSVMCCHRI